MYDVDCCWIDVGFSSVHSEWKNADGNISIVVFGNSKANLFGVVVRRVLAKLRLSNLVIDCQVAWAG